MALITGSLPAQYGLRTTGVIDIQTKTGTLDPGGSLTLYGGQQGTFQPSAEWGGRVGQIDYYATGEYLQNGEGIENPAPTFNAIHDKSQQPKGFAYVSGIIDPTSRLTAILGASRSQFQIPQVAGQTPSLGLTVNGISDFASASLNENQRQINNFGILAWQKQVDDIDFQIAGFTRYSSVYFSPGDPTGDLLFNGIAQTAYRQSWASGVQGDGSWRASSCPGRNAVYQLALFTIGARLAVRHDPLPPDDAVPGAQARRAALCRKRPARPDSLPVRSWRADRRATSEHSWS